MTTPERLKRRQIRESIGLAVLGIMVVFSTLYDSHQRGEQADHFQTCIAVQVKALTDSLTSRGRLNQDDSDSVRNVILSVADSVGQNDFSKIQRALSNYVVVQGRIAKERKDHPVPPFPNGKCD